MMIFVDFDDVLFNTKKFKNDYIKFFGRHGINKNIFAKYYYWGNKKNNKVRAYFPGNQLRGIKENENIKIKLTEKEISKFIKDTSRYIFKDVLSFIGCFKKDDIYIVSYPKGDFIKKKILNSGISKYFKGVFLTNELKSSVIKRIVRRNKIKNKPTYFLDDRLEQLKDVKKSIPEIMTILIRRREGRYQNKKNKFCDFEAKNLREAYQIIKQTCQ